MIRRPTGFELAPHRQLLRLLPRRLHAAFGAEIAVGFARLLRAAVRQRPWRGR